MPAQTSDVIVDARVFDPDHLPQQIVGRNMHMQRVTSALQPVRAGERAENVYLLGPSGAGKTTVAKAAIRKLREAVLDVHSGYVNCWRDDTRISVLRGAVEQLTDAVYHRNSTSRQELQHLLESHLDEPAVLILDEVDQLQEKKALYDLYDLGISWIAIANTDEELLSDVDDRVASRMSAARRVRFDRYSDEQLTEILRRRATQGLVSDAVSERQLERIAQASEGDARRAIGILRVAAREARGTGAGEITDEVLLEAVPIAESEVVAEHWSKLNDHQRVALQVIVEEGPLIQKDLYDAYQQRHASPVSLRSLRENHFEKLLGYDLITVERTGRGKVFDAPDPVKQAAIFAEG